MTKKMVVAMSTSCLDYCREPHNIRLVRLNIKLGKDKFIDGQDITAAQFEDWLLEHPNELAQTSPPSSNYLGRFFLQLLDEGYQEVLVVAMSSVLSQTGNMIRELIPVFAGKLTIHVFESCSATFPEGYMALEAERCLRAGMSIEQTMSRLHHLRTHNTLMFAVHDLNYLINNGRLSSAAGFIANMFNIKPIIQVTPRGEAVVAERIMSFSRAMNNMVGQLGQYRKKGGKQHVYLLYTGAPRELFYEFEAMVAKKHNLRNLPAYPISPVISAHVGPNAVGFGIFWDL